MKYCLFLPVALAIAATCCYGATHKSVEAPASHVKSLAVQSPSQDTKTQLSTLAVKVQKMQLTIDQLKVELAKTNEDLAEVKLQGHSTGTVYHTLTPDQMDGPPMPLPGHPGMPGPPRFPELPNRPGMPGQPGQHNPMLPPPPTNGQGSVPSPSQEETTF